MLAACRQDEARLIGERTQSVGAGLAQERAPLLPLASEGFDLAEVSFATVDNQSRVKVRTTWYSVPLRAGTKVRIRVLPAHVEVWHEGRLVAQHERCYSRLQQILDLEHYLDVLELNREPWPVPSHWRNGESRGAGQPVLIEPVLIACGTACNSGTANRRARAR